MASTVLSRFCNLCRVFIKANSSRLLDRLRPPNQALPVLAVECGFVQGELATKNDDPLGFDGILYAVPKSRKTIERRRLAKFGFVKRMENAQLNPNIVPCRTCGNWHEKHTICGHCYEKVREKTTEMQAELAKSDAYYFGQDTESISQQLKRSKNPDDDVEPEQLLWWHENLKKKVT